MHISVSMQVQAFVQPCKWFVAGFWHWEEQGIEYKAQRLIWVIDNQNMLRDVKTITKQKHGWPNTLGKKQTHTQEKGQGETFNIAL